MDELREILADLWELVEVFDLELDNVYKQLDTTTAARDELVTAFYELLADLQDGYDDAESEDEE